MRLYQNTYEKRMIVIYDNASIHKTKKVRITGYVKKFSQSDKKISQNFDKK